MCLCPEVHKLINDIRQRGVPADTNIGSELTVKVFLGSQVKRCYICFCHSSLISVPVVLFFSTGAREHFPPYSFDYAAHLTPIKTSTSKSKAAMEMDGKLFFSFPLSLHPYHLLHPPTGQTELWDRMTVSQ